MPDNHECHNLNLSVGGEVGDVRGAIRHVLVKRSHAGGF